VGTDGKVESDQQYRGFRWWEKEEGAGRRTTISRGSRRPEGAAAYIGYGIDSVSVALAAICRMKFFGASRQSVGGDLSDGGGSAGGGGDTSGARLVRI